MGETAADTRREIAERRNNLAGTVAQLKAKGPRLAALARRYSVMSVGVVVGFAAVAGGVLAMNQRRGGKLAGTARGLPSPVRHRAVSLARGAERRLSMTERAMSRRGEDLVEAISVRVADRQARAHREANPLWRRAVGKALETAAAVGTAALIRRALSSDRREADPSPSEWRSGNHAQAPEASVDDAHPSASGRPRTRQPVAAGKAG